MQNYNIYHDGNQNNGLITKIWGPSGWTFGHSIAFGYPIEPTDKHKADYRIFFESLMNVLPCSFCRDSYHKFIMEGNTKFTDDKLQNRETLTKWFYDIHNAVNNKLGIDYGVTYDDHVIRYESFRARCGPPSEIVKATGCVTPLDYKAFSYKKLNRKDCPVIPIDIASPFIRLAKIRNLDRKLFDFYNKFISDKKCIFDYKNTDIWTARNKYCQKQIKYMRETGIPSIESQGEWDGTPTIDELKLLVQLSSVLGKCELADCLLKIQNHPIYLSHITSIY